MSSSRSAKRNRRAKRARRQIKAAQQQPESPLTLRASVTFDGESLIQAQEGQEERLPTFSLQAYNGGKMKPAGWRYPVVVDLAGVSHDGRVPVFLDHEVSGRGLVGHANIATDGAITAEGVVSADTEAAHLVVSSAKRGFPWQVSIGADPQQKAFVKEGETRTINGSTHSGPFYHVERSHVHELSFVPIGADSTTSASIAANLERRTEEMAEENVTQQQATEEGSEKLPAKFVRWVEAQGFDIDEQTENQMKILKAAYAKENEEKGQELTEDVAQYMRSTRAAEIERQKKICDLTRFNTELQTKAIAEGWSPEATELALYREENRRAPKSTAWGRSMNLSARAIEAAICNQVGMQLDWLDARADHWKNLRGVTRGYTEQELDAATGLGDYSFGRLMHEFLYSNGVSVPPGTTIAELIPKCKDTHRMLKASTGFSTISLSGIMSNALNKSLLASFETVQPVFQQISSSRSVNDFKETKAYRLSGNGDFVEIGDGGEIQSIGLREEEFSNRAKTYGRMISVTRQQLINDDLGALANVTRILGRKAALNVQKVGFTAFLAAVNAGTFFTATHGNLIDDTLDIVGLTAAERAFMMLEDEDGDPIDVQPAILLVPPTLKTTAEELMNGTTTIMVQPGATGAAVTNYTRWPAVNPHVGKWRILTSPWLENSSLTGYSAAYWYLLAPPSVVSALEIVYLNGRQTPTIESEDSDFSTLGFQWRAYMDFGVATQDWRAGVCSSGSDSSHAA